MEFKHKNMISRKEISFDQTIPYHVLSRTVEKRKIFINDEDCLRFIFQIYAATIGKPAPNLHRKDIIKAAKDLLNGLDVPENLIIVEHAPLVYVLSFNEVINHYHLVLIPNLEGGIPKYTQKLKTGFAMYHNLKYNRQGNLFEKPYKIIPVQSNFQLDAVLRYVNVKNSLDIFQPDWAENGLKNEKEALEFLKEYQFSSFPDLFGERNSKILAPREILEKYLGKEIIESKEEYINFVKAYLQKKLISFHPFFLEE